MTTPSLILRQISSEHTLALRALVLRDGGSIDTAHYAGDDLPTTFHVGAFGQDGEQLATASVMFGELSPHSRHTVASRLRGVAVRKELHGKGVGAAVVRECMKLAKQRGTPFMWCTARIGVLPFYEKLGFEIVGPVFDMPYGGPHRHAQREL